MSLETSIKQINEAISRLGKQDQLARQRAIESANTIEEMIEAQERSYTFTTADLADVIRDATKDLDPELLNVEHGFPKIIELYKAGESTTMEVVAQYKGTDVNSVIARNLCIAVLIFWGKIMDIDMSAYNALHFLIKSHNVPDNAVPVVDNLISRGNLNGIR